MCKVSCSTQETVGEIDAYDLGAAFGKRKRVPPMTATDIDDARGLRQAEDLPDATRLESHAITGCCQAPALAVTAFKVLVSPIRHGLFLSELRMAALLANRSLPPGLLILRRELLAGLDPERRIRRQDTVGIHVLLHEVVRIFGYDGAGQLERRGIQGEALDDV